MEKRIEHKIKEDKTITPEMKELKELIKRADTITALSLFSIQMIKVSEKLEWKWAYLHKEYIKRKKQLKK